MSNLPHVPDEHLKAIAHVAIRSAQLDHMLETTLAILFGWSSNTAEMILKEWTQNKQVKLIRAVLTDRYPWHKDDIEAFISTVTAARGERNDVIHYLWGKADETGAAKLASYRPFRQDKTKSMTAAQVHAVANDLLDCVQKLHRLTEWLHAEHNPPPNALVHMLQRPNSVWPLAQGPQAPTQAPSPPQSPHQKSDPQP